MSELFVVLLIALLVIKPDDLPKVAFTIGKFYQKGRRFIKSVKDDLNGFYEDASKEKLNK